ncbi:MAG: 23S rRNA (cytosine(1962)-C(5))-methyltransferase RlmI [Kiritimatiellaceae bacterium]|nr:23S rRNA (cytosine(1962)-C(5))-methyltransferase RlmI [Kiritimatiellaceae bacterium]
MNSVILKKGREKNLLQRHPWIFSGAIERVEVAPGVGETVTVCSFDRKPLAQAAWSPQSQISLRVWSFNPATVIDADFFRTKLKNAIAARGKINSNALRLVAAESDGLPGLIIDRYADWLVCQFLSAGSEFWKDTIVELLQELFPGLSIYERSDVSVREKEGLPSRCGVLSGAEPPEHVEIEESGMRLLVDIKGGHKTGYYLDQRDSRLAVRQWAEGRDVLNCFSYTGGFGVAALLGGAKHVLQMDSSGPALEIAKQNATLNGLDPAASEYIEGDVFKELRRFRDSRRDFDLIILDPPKFIESRNQLEKGARGYKDINLLAFKLLRPGGLLFTFSCSGLMEMPLFQKIVADSALDAGRNGQILAVLNQSPDHPIALNFPEGAYLKGLLCRAE